MQHTSSSRRDRTTHISRYALLHSTSVDSSGPITLQHSIVGRPLLLNCGTKISHVHRISKQNLSGNCSYHILNTVAYIGSGIRNRAQVPRLARIMNSNMGRRTKDHKQILYPEQALASSRCLRIIYNTTGHNTAGGKKKKGIESVRRQSRDDLDRSECSRR